MAEKCLGCGKNAIRSGKYWLIVKDSFNQRTLLGAATLGLCPDCIIKYTRPTLKKPILRAGLWTLAAIVIAAFFFIGDFLHDGNTKTYLLFAAMMAVAVFMDVRIITNITTFMKKLHDPEFVKTMEDEDFEYAAVKMLIKTKRLDKNIIFNADALEERAKKIAETGLSDRSRDYVKRAIVLPAKFKEFGIEKMHRDYVNIPSVRNPDMTKNENIKKAIKIVSAEYYEREIKV